jgi:hypothetical protein
MRRLFCGSALAVLLLVTACSSRSMDDFERNPADRGLLHALQTSEMKDPTSRGYTVQVETKKGGLDDEREQTLTLHVLNPEGKPVSKFTLDMTKLFHLIVVSRDLSSFAHIHPDYKGDGTFEVSYRFPFGGEFQLVSEFAPDGQDVAVYRQWVDVAGEKHPGEPMRPDALLQHTIGSVSVTLNVAPDLRTLKAGQMAMLNFHLTDAATGRPIAEVQPYLGTLGHVAVMDATASRYLHVHAVDDMSGGADVMFHTAFPAAGVYKIWGQFQVQGEPVVAPFVLRVQ